MQVFAPKVCVEGLGRYKYIYLRSYLALNLQQVSGKHAYQQPLKYSPGNKHHLLFWMETVEWRMFQRDREDNAADDAGREFLLYI